MKFKLIKKTVSCQLKNIGQIVQTVVQGKVDFL